MFIRLGSEKGGRILKFLRLDYFGQKNFEPVKKLDAVLINEKRFFHIGYFAGSVKSGNKVFISFQDLERLTSLITGEVERIKERAERQLDTQQAG